jgi:hypothetical protein
MVPEALAPGPDGSKPICELAPGDAVWSWVDGQMQPHRILYARRSKDQPVLKLRTRSRIVEASADHLFLRVVRTSPNRHAKGGRCGEQTGATYGAEWTHLDQLRRGDLLVVLDETPDTGIVEVLPDGTDVTGDVAWLLGVILGDGTITDRHIRVCVYGETCQQVRRITAETSAAMPKRSRTTRRKKSAGGRRSSRQSRNRVGTSGHVSSGRGSWVGVCDCARPRFSASLASSGVRSW